MSSFWWTILPVLLAVLSKANCESTAYPVIPKYLLECYRDQGIYHRANRMPASFSYFVDLIRKVEASPTSRNLNARELAMVLLHYVKLDGIQSIRTDTQYFPSNIIPFAPSGAEYFKHRLTLVGMVPRIDPSYQAAINESLTKKEMCNLHFMLSYSFDPYKRPDERCSPLSEDTRQGTNPEPRPEWNPYHTFGGYYKRYRRHIQHPHHTNELHERHGKVYKHARKSSRPSGTKDSLRQKRSVTPEHLEKSQVEEINVPQHPNAGRKPKDKFTIGDQELLSAGELRHGAGMQSLVQSGSFGRYGSRGYPRPVHATDDSVYSGVIPGIPLSECPVVNGVIKTPHGSLTVGTVIAGIAAGLNPEDIPPRKLSVEPEELESPSDRLKNIWGTTLAGTVADVISSSALLDNNNLQIIKGGWNDSSDPRWYLLSNNQFSHLPEVALRGALDGLFLGLNAKDWTNKFPGFKLSQMLQIYYNNGWGNVKAMNRVQLRGQYAPDELFRKQTHLMSLVLKKQKTNVLTVLDYNQVSRDAVGRVIQHINTMDVNKKSSIGSFSGTGIDSIVNMIAVIDSSWGFETLSKVFEELRAAEVVNVQANGSNLTVLCGKDGRVLFSSGNSVDAHNLFTKDMLFENCSRGLDIPLVLDVLDTMYRKIFNDEKLSLNMNTDAQVAVLFPFESLPQDYSYVREKSQNFRRTFPGVRLMIASNGRSENYAELLDSQKDLFPLVPFMADPNSKTFAEFVDGVKQSYQRLSRPSCGSYFNDDTPETETRVTRDVGLGTIAYYRLLPQYFYTQHGQATVTVRSKLRAPLTVCHSRKVDRPTGPTSRGPGHDYGNRNPEYSPDFPPEASPYERQTVEEEVQCKTITTEVYKIEMQNPCEGAPGLRECDPLYVSLSAPLQETINYACQTCRLPTNVQYEITVSGLTCYNSAAVKLLSPLLFSLLSLYYLLKHFF